MPTTDDRLPTTGYRRPRFSRLLWLFLLRLHLEDQIRNSHGHAELAGEFFGAPMFLFEAASQRGILRLH